MNRSVRGNASRRWGVVLAAVLLSLLVVLLVGAELTRAIALQHRQSRLAEDRQQAFWIAESAVQRAVDALAKSPDYRGESWRVPAEVLGSGHAGAATITVEPLADSATGRRIRVRAEYPDDPVYRTLCERELILD